MKRITRLVIEVESEQAEVTSARSLLVRVATAAGINMHGRINTLAGGTTARWWLESVEDQVLLKHDAETLERIETVTRLVP